MFTTLVQVTDYRYLVFYRDISTVWRRIHANGDTAAWGEGAAREEKHMGRIKSAWEIALERTEDIHADPDKIQHDSLIKEGRQLAGSFLTDIDKTLEDIKEKLSTYDVGQLETVKQGMAMTLLFNMALPLDDGYKTSLQRLHQLADVIDPQATPLIDQLEGFFGQYLETQEHLVDRMKQQFQPMLEQKQAQLRQQYGPDFILRPEQDPEFVKLLQQNLKQLTAQYQQALDQAKDQLREMFGIEEQ
jgi:hypothetical protein